MLTDASGAGAEPGFHLPTLREALAPLFRYRLVVAATAAIGAVLVVAIVTSLPTVYEAEMKILVNRERADSLMSADAQSQAPQREEITEAELFSAVELIQSRDLLEQVADAAGIDRLVGDSATTASPTAQRAAAVAVLHARLTAEPVKKTTIIRVAFRAHDPHLAASVLAHLSTLFLAKHLAVHRPAGASEFFAAQVQRSGDELAAAQAALAAFGAREHVVSASGEKDQVLQRLGEFQASAQQIAADSADAAMRLASLHDRAAATPERHVTQIRNTATVDTVRTLRQQILTARLARDEMQKKFTAEYPPLARLEEQITRLDAALAEATGAPLRDETSDQNPTAQWLQTEIARVGSERAALSARAAAIHRSIDEYRRRAERLDTQSVGQDQLRQNVATADATLAMYRRKQEEARVSDALDRMRIANVAIADAPSVPQEPSGPPVLLLLAAGFGAVGVGSAGAGYAAHLARPRFHTPGDVATLLGVPVLATLPVAD